MKFKNDNYVKIKEKVKCNEIIGKMYSTKWNTRKALTPKTQVSHTQFERQMYTYNYKSNV